MLTIKSVDLLEDRSKVMGLRYTLSRCVLVAMVISRISQSAAEDTCSIKSIHESVVLLGGPHAGDYRPIDDGPLRDMNREKCVVHCCNDKTVDMAFMINNYCYCVRCRNTQLCTPVPITPPYGFRPVAMILHRKTGTSPRPKSTPTSPRFFTTKAFSTNFERTTKFEGRNLQTNPTSKNAGQQQEGKGLGRRLSTTQKVTTFAATTKRPTTRPTRMVTVDRTVTGKGNLDISLQCSGTMLITRITAFGMAGNDKTVKDFNEYCKTNLHTMDNTKVCVVSLKRVYKESYPPFVTTEIEYKCTYGTTV